MDITIIGAGTVGEATGLGLSQMGHNVTFCDQDEAQLLRLAGQRVSTSIVRGELYLICTHEKDVENVIKEIDDKGFKDLIVVRSSTSPGTVAKLMARYKRHIAHIPEFCREKNAFTDFLYPARIAIGECCRQHGTLLEHIFDVFDAPIIRTDTNTSELAKLVCNSHLATLISFWNEVEQIAEHLGVDGDKVIDIATSDPRISNYGTISLGSFGGKCLPKDLESLIKVAYHMQKEPTILEAVKEKNREIEEEEKDVPPEQI